MKYSKALVILAFVLVGVNSQRTVDDMDGGRWSWAIAHGFLALGNTVLGLHNLNNLKRKDQCD